VATTASAAPSGHPAPGSPRAASHPGQPSSAGNPETEYELLRNLSPVEYLDRWWTVEGSWNRPGHDAVVADTQSLKELQELPSGWMLDRVGSPWGSFLAHAPAPASRHAS